MEIKVPETGFQQINNMYVLYMVTPPTSQSIPTSFWSLSYVANGTMKAGGGKHSSEKARECYLVCVRESLDYNSSFSSLKVAFSNVLSSSGNRPGL